MIPKISIIIPVYKAEKYIHKCIESLQNQTFKDYEILLIDDGSPDSSGKICDDYAKYDKRIRVFHKNNGGVSSARQCGIDNAQGEYTIHVDPDDWVEPTMLEELYQKAKENDADMVICDYYINYKNKEIYIRQNPTSLDSETVLREMFQHLRGSCCNKLVNRRCYTNVSFPVGVNYCEDLSVCIQILKHPKKINYLAKAFYHYNQYINPDSITRIFTAKTLNEHFNYINLLREYFCEEKYKRLLKLGILDVLYNEFLHNSISHREFKMLAYEALDELHNFKIPLFSKVLFYLTIKVNRKIFGNLFYIIYKLYNLYRN